MSMRAVTAIGAAVIGVLLACGGLLAGLVGGAANASCMAIPIPNDTQNDTQKVCRVRPGQ